MNQLHSTPTSADWAHDSTVSVEIKSLLASTWAVLQQPPPPSIREVLTAYNAKGTGDRDMLLAMLNAKSAEDQRIAALATLQNSMLQIYSTAAAASAPTPVAPLSPASLPRSDGRPQHHHQHPFAPAQAPPPARAYEHQQHQHQHQHHLPPSPASRVNLPPMRGEPSRKRARSSRSPERHSPYSSRQHSPASGSQSQYHYRRPSSHEHDRDHEPEHLPRGAMAINSLLSSAYRAASPEDASWVTGAPTSAERSTTVPVSETR